MAPSDAFHDQWQLVYPWQPECLRGMPPEALFGSSQAALVKVENACDFGEAMRDRVSGTRA